MPTRHCDSFHCDKYFQENRWQDREINHRSGIKKYSKMVILGLSNIEIVIRIAENEFSNRLNTAVDRFSKLENATIKYLY